MLVECIYNNIEKTTDSRWLKENTRNYYKGMENRIFIGKKYVVYGIQFSEFPFIFIYEDEDDRFPIAFPLACFTILDSRLSRYFTLGKIKEYQTQNPKYVPFISFKEWAENLSFWEELVEGDHEQLSIGYKTKIDLEYFNPTIELNEELLILLENRWFLCPKCDNGWEILEIDEIIMCPKCNSLYKNPII